MKLTVVQKTQPIYILGRFTPEDICPTHERLVYIDDKPVPHGLARLILLGLDTAAEQYSSFILQEMKQEGHEI